MMKRSDPIRRPLKESSKRVGAHRASSFREHLFGIQMMAVALLFFCCDREDTNIRDDWYPLIELSSETLILDHPAIVGPAELVRISASDSVAATLEFDYDEVEFTEPSKILEPYYEGFDYTFNVQDSLQIDIDSLVGIPQDIVVVQYSNFHILVDSDADVRLSFYSDVQPLGIFEIPYTLEAEDSVSINMSATIPGGVILYLKALSTTPANVRVYLNDDHTLSIFRTCTSADFKIQQIYDGPLVFDPTPSSIRSGQARFSEEGNPWEVVAATDAVYNLVLVDAPDDDRLIVDQVDLASCWSSLNQRLRFQCREDGVFMLPSYLDEKKQRINGLTTASPFREGLFNDLRRFMIDDVPAASDPPRLRIQWDNSDLALPVIAQYYMDTELYGQIDVCPPFQMDIGGGVDTIPLTTEFLTHYDSIIGNGEVDPAEQIRICVRIQDGTEVLTEGLEGQLIIDQSLLPF